VPNGFERYNKNEKGTLEHEEWDPFIEYLLTPRIERYPKTEKEWAAKHDVSDRSLRRWKKNEAFQTKLRNRMRETSLDPERVNEVLSAVFNAAAGGDMQAAKLYLQHAQELDPGPQVIAEERSVSDMSNDEIKQALAELLS
jgi:SOS response regulatory protein OraA/RecX